MPATMGFSTTATTPFSKAASLKYYNSKSLKELKVLAKIHNVSDAGEPQDIVARLMESDRKSKTWPGIYDDPNMKKNSQDSGVAPVKQKSMRDETLLETKVAATRKGKSNTTVTTSPASTNAMCSKNTSSAILISQLSKEWDVEWGPPFAFAKAATINSKSQGTSVNTAVSTSSSQKSPVSPVSPAASSASSISNRYNVLVAEAVEDETSALKKNTGKAPSVHEETEKGSLVHEQDSVSTSNNDIVDTEEKTKQEKNKRGKKGGKKVNKYKPAAQYAESGSDTTDASASNVTATTKQPEDIPAAFSAAKSESIELTPEPAVDVSGPTPTGEENNSIIVETSPSVAPTEIDESVDEKIDLAESEPTEGTRDSFSPSQTSAPEQYTPSMLIATPTETTKKPTKKAPVQVFLVTPQPPPPSNQSAPSQSASSVPAKTKNQKHNEKRKQEEPTSLNKFTVLAPDQSAVAAISGEDKSAADHDSASTFAPISSDTKEDENKKDGDVAAPAAKKNKRGKKGGKKAQAQKKNQPVPVVQPALVLAAIPAKIEPVHVAVVVIVAFFAAVFGAWATG